MNKIFIYGGYFKIWGHPNIQTYITSNFIGKTFNKKFVIKNYDNIKLLHFIL